MSATGVINWIEGTEVYDNATKKVPSIIGVTENAKKLAGGIDSNIKIVSEAATVVNLKEAVSKAQDTVSSNATRARAFASSKVSETAEIAKERVSKGVSHLQQQIESSPQVKSKADAVLSILLSIISQAKAYSDEVPATIAHYQSAYSFLETNFIIASVLLMICKLFIVSSSVLERFLPSEKREMIQIEGESSPVKRKQSADKKKKNQS